MNINLTLIGQTITFAIFVWFCMKFIWPPIVLALETRRKQVADGLAAGDRGRHELELAAKYATKSLREAKMKAAEIIAQSEKRSAQIIDEARNAAKVEGEHMLAVARAELEQDVFRAREQLRDHVAALVVAGAEKVLRREVDAGAHADLLEAIKNEL